MTGLDSPRAFLALCGIAFLAMIVAKNLYAFFLARFQLRLVHGGSAKVEGALFQRYMASPYAFHLERNSAALINRLDSTVHSVFAGALLGYIGMATETAMVAAIAAFLLMAEPFVTVLAGLVLGGCMGAIVVFTRRRMADYGAASMQLRESRLQCLQQSLSSVKEVKVLGCEPYFTSAFDHLTRNYAHQIECSTTLAQLPRLVVETVLVAGIVAAILHAVLTGRDPSEITGVLALFAAATFRLVPSLNRAVMAINNVRFAAPAVRELAVDFHLLEEARPALDASLAILPQGTIQLRDVAFAYGDGPLVLKGVSLTVEPGESIGFVSPSGAGKSTLIDIVIGLLKPDSGSIRVGDVDITVDPRPWQAQIGYVPQSVALIDDSIRANIAFGIEPARIDEERVWRAVEAAQLGEFVRNSTRGLDTFVGERGVRLSGGQRQRIGIARALYRDPKVMVLDEATSALDNETEREISDAIDALRGSKTLLIIAHRLSTIRRCDRIVLMEEGRIADMGGFAELLERNAHFRHLVNLAELVREGPEDVEVLR